MKTTKGRLTTALIPTVTPKLFTYLVLCCLLPGLAFSQAPIPAPVVTVTPNMISITMGTQLYCALRPITAPSYQIYCYTTGVMTCTANPDPKTNTCFTVTKPGAVWDNLIYNSLFSVPSVPSGQGLSYGLHSGGSPNSAQASWMVWEDPLTGLQWQVSAGETYKHGLITATGFVAQ